ncbi:hypothetical protein DUK53_00240 [Listeria sp. SHR_NRA_18]|uniref:DUF6270 domain-containing protein n=1 Tax=Listeria TaxID=1637 RepID=UPI00051D8BA4|nr:MULTISPECIES: DUF6270 domain-containing protein [Listeria]KGL38664.1 hypothetical protein EP56_15985 [Listeriaceae bacterium FSL A5-0209]KMT58999.1 hypothetical protein X559_2787 [Listeria newyorkensis]RQW67844.1 hypothetical protein DUK53_00240 [Listeria sp. SHR_NRA_18]
MGSCLTRDNFNTTFNPDYKDFFECVLHQHQCSFLSLMSPALPLVEDEETAKMNAFTGWHYKTEHTKEFLSLIQTRKPEYLLLDAYADIYLGVVEATQGYFTYNPKFKDVPPVKDSEAIWTITADFESYFKAWMQHVDAFFQFLHEKVPFCKIVLVKARFEDVFEDGTSLNEWREGRNYPTVDIERLNGIWDMLDQYVVAHFHVQILDMTQKKYTLDKDHPWGNFYVHYTRDFYHDFLFQLKELTKGDEIR